MKKISLKSLFNIITVLSIIFAVFINNGSFTNYVRLFYVTLSFFVILLYFNSGKVKKIYLLLILLLVILILISYLFGFGKISNLIIFFSFLLIVYIQYYDFEISKTKPSDFLNKLLYFVGFIFVIYHIYFNLFKVKSLGLNYYLISMSDKNYASVYIFLYYCFCLKINKKIGAILSLILGFFFYSRLFFIAVPLQLIIYFFEKKSKSTFLDIVKRFKFKQIISIFLCSTLFVIGISYYMTFYIPVSSISDYRETFNDNSNAIRVRANVYAVNKLLTDRKIIFSGYDSSIKDFIGQRSSSASEQYYGFSIVQPHNFLLNLLLRFGLIMTIAYLCILCKVLEKLWINNISFIISYLFMNMFMHSLFTTIFLIFFVYILNIDSNKIGGEL